MQDPTGRQRQGFPPRAQCFHLPQGAIPLSDITQQVWEEDEAISLSLVLSPKAGWGPGLGLGTGRLAPARLPVPYLAYPSPLNSILSHPNPCTMARVGICMATRAILTAVAG